MKLLFCIFSLFTIFITPVFSVGKLDSTHCNNTWLNLANEDAYYIYDNTELEVLNNYPSIKHLPNYYYRYKETSQYTYSSRLKINTKSGVDKYAFLSFNNTIKSVLKSFSVTTYKQNGTVAHFDSTQIFHTIVSNSTDTEADINITKYVIPNVEVGDEIEVSYSIEYPSYFARNCYGNIFMSHSIPTLAASYKITAPDPLVLKFKSYNRFNTPTLKHEIGKSIYTFKVDSVPSITNSEYSSLYFKHPYFYYSFNVDTDDSPDIKWKNIYNYFIACTHRPFRNKRALSNAKYAKWLRENLSDVTGQDKYQKFEHLYRKIFNDFEILSSNETSKSSYRLKSLFHNKISRDNLFILYANIFKSLDIYFYPCVGRIKYLGPIDDDNIRKGEITDYYFLYYGKDMKPVIVYPHMVDRKFYLNELPTGLCGTNTYLLKNSPEYNLYGTLMPRYVTNDYDLVVQRRKVGIGNVNTDGYKRTRTVHVDLASALSDYSSDLSFSGYASLDNRARYTQLLTDKAACESYIDRAKSERNELNIDSIYLISSQDEYPFRYVFGIDGKLRNFYNRLNDTTIVIPLKDMLTDISIDYDRDTRESDIVLTAVYSNTQELLVEFDQPVSVLNKSALEKSIENSIGHYAFRLEDMGGNKFKIVSTYRIKTDQIEKKDFNALNALNDLYNEMSNIQLLISTEKTPESVVEKRSSEHDI